MLSRVTHFKKNCKQWEPFAKDEQEEQSKLVGAELLKSRVKPEMLRRYIEQTVANEYKVYDREEVPQDRKSNSAYVNEMHRVKDGGAGTGKNDRFYTQLETYY